VSSFEFFQSPCFFSNNPSCFLYGLTKEGIRHLALVIRSIFDPKYLHLPFNAKQTTIGINRVGAHLAIFAQILFDLGRHNVVTIKFFMEFVVWIAILRILIKINFLVILTCKIPFKLRAQVCLSIRNCIKRAPKSTVLGQHRFGFEKPSFCSL